MIGTCVAWHDDDCGSAINSPFVRSTIRPFQSSLCCRKSFRVDFLSLAPLDVFDSWKHCLTAAVVYDIVNVQP